MVLELEPSLLAVFSSDGHVDLSSGFLSACGAVSESLTT